MYNRNYEIDMESVAAYLKDAVNKVKTQENPDVLNDIKKTFKKNVPLTLRMYVAAYLVKEMQKGGKGGFRSSRRDFHENKKFSSVRQPRERDIKAYSSESGEERTPHPRVQIDPTLASTIFISIGRNRRVFPRDLVGLLISVAGLERDRIGDIRVLANYSFVQLFSEDAEKTIAALNGYDYRGRKLAVSYSRQKDAEDGDETAQPYVSDSASYSADASIDENQLAEDAAAYAAAEKAAANNEPFSAPHISSEPGDAPKNDYLV